MAAALSPLSRLALPALHHVKVNNYSTLISRSGHLRCVFGSEGKRQCVGNLGTHKLALETTIIKRRSTTARAMAGSAEGTSRQYIALVYDYVPDILEKRGPHREEHLARANEKVGEGKLLLGGAWGSPVDGALFVFHVNGIEEVEKFVEGDPYVKNGLVTKVDIRPYSAIIGSQLVSS